MAREYREGGGGKVELNSTTIAPPERQADWTPTTSANRNVFKRGHRMFESLNLRLLVAEGGFEATISLANPTKKDLLYLKGQINGTNVSMLVHTGASNSFMMPRCTVRLKTR